LITIEKKKKERKKRAKYNNGDKMMLSKNC
jgi:hypothetical protein